MIDSTSKEQTSHARPIPSDYPGFEADLRIPIQTSQINAEIARTMPTQSGPIVGIAVAALASGNAALIIDMNQWPLPKRIELPVMFLATALPYPGLVMTFLDPPKLLQMIMPTLHSHLPAALTLDRTQARLDLRPLIEQAGVGEWLPFLRRLQLTLEAGRVIVTASIRVPEE